MFSIIKKIKMRDNNNNNNNHYLLINDIMKIVTKPLFNHCCNNNSLVHFLYRILKNRITIPYCNS